MDWSRYLARLAPAPPPPCLASIVAEVCAAQTRRDERASAVILSARPATTGAATGGSSPGANGSATLRQRLRDLAAPQRRERLAAHVHEQVARVLGFGPTHSIDPDRGFADMGLDSLMAVELRNQLQSSLAQPLPLAAALEHSTVDALTAFLEPQLFPPQSAAGPGANGTTGTNGAHGVAAVAGSGGGDIATFENLSDADVERLLAEKLGSDAGRGRQWPAGGQPAGQRPGRR
jgi:acyl carrier protein